MGENLVKPDFVNQSKYSKFIRSYKKNFIEILVAVIFIASWVLLSEFWVGVINTVLVKPIMSKLSPGIGFFTFIIFVLISFYYLLVWSTERILSKSRFVLTGTTAAIYLLCFFSGEWVFKTLIENWKLLSYANVLLLPIIGEMIHLCLLLRNHSTVVAKSELEFEQALQEGNVSDSYNRNPYIRAISAHLISAFDSNGSFAIGISGKWGTGKSSFINMLKGKLRNSADIIIEFKPWYCRTPNDIIEEFFKKYQSEISQYAPNVSCLIKEYSRALAEIEESKIASWLNYSISRFDAKDIQSQYDEIKNKLLKLNLKVVVIIDDLDRLDTGEVMEVLRLIRNSANFPYTQFIVAYDKDYVIQSISCNNIPNAPQFLEKIFNLEITLPKFEERIICVELLTRIEEIVAQIGISENDTLTRAMVYLYDKANNEDLDLIVPKILKTKRDVIRFVNSFILNLKPFIDTKNYQEIDFKHFFYLELIRYGFPEIYTLLRDNPLLILDVDFKNRRFKYISKPGKEGRDGNPLPAEEDEFLNIYLTSDHLKNKKEIYFLLNEMFQFRAGEDYSNGIWHLRSYGKYFSYRLDNEIISVADMLLLLDNGDAIQEIEGLYSSKKLGEIEDKLSVCYSYLTPEEIVYKNGDKTEIKNESKLPFKRVYGFVKLLLKSENQGLIKEVLTATHFHMQPFVTYSRDQLKSLLDLWMYMINLHDSLTFNDNIEILISVLYKDNLSIKIKSIVDSSDVEIIRNLLVNTICPTIISQLISRIIDVHKRDGLDDEKLTLPIQSLREIQLSYLKIYLSEKTELDADGITLLYQCKESTDSSTQNVILNNEALKLMRSFIEVHPDGYILNFIRTGQSSSETFNKVFPEPYYEDLFKTNEAFEKFILQNKLSSVKGIEKVRNYWKIYKYNDFRPVEFNNQGVVSEIINSNFKMQIEQLDMLIDIDNQVDEIAEDFENIGNTKSLTHEKRIKLEELESLRGNIYLFITLNGKINSKIVSMLSTPSF